VFKRIAIVEANRLQQEAEAQVVDIRDPQSYALGHIEGSIRVDNQSLPTFLDSADKNKPLVVVCYHGNSSQQAAEFFNQQGFHDVYSMDGGFEAWKLQYPYAESDSN